VDLYVDFVFNKSVALHYTAFHKGFMKVCSGRVIQIFQPEELMAVVVGNEDYDWQALQDNCEYREGYTSGDDTVSLLLRSCYQTLTLGFLTQIKWFWEVIHDLSEAEKKSFLLYLTGSDRIPIQGMKALKVSSYIDFAAVLRGFKKTFSAYHSTHPGRTIPARGSHLLQSAGPAAIQDQGAPKVQTTAGHPANSGL